MAVIDGSWQGAAPACFVWLDKSNLPWESGSESGLQPASGSTAFNSSSKAHGPAVISNAGTERVGDPDSEAHGSGVAFLGLIQPGIRM